VLDSSVLPAGLRRVTDAVLACVSMLEKEPGGKPLEGMGIGDRAYTGRARLASQPEDILATFAPGDILVAAWTAPTFNSVIASAGAMVVEEGGLLCHAAVIARELGVPAVIGATGALSMIEEGATVTVDPVAGRVTIEAST
ncbi:MAG: pyruvate kinase, partial [Actinomycetia bacterium]|nr:pyruvate kinase [Actinomycetes bacterium]